MNEWPVNCHAAIEAAIVRFKRDLPGWWYSLCECQVSCDASCAPTPLSEHIALIPCDDRFNAGFHADVPQPSTLSEALDIVREDALTAIRQLSSSPTEGVGG